MSAVYDVAKEAVVRLCDINKQEIHCMPASSVHAEAIRRSLQHEPRKPITLDLKNLKLSYWEEGMQALEMAHDMK